MYKDLSLKEKAKVLQYGGKLGLTSVEDIAKLYDEAIGHTFQTKGQMEVDVPNDYPTLNEYLAKRAAEEQEQYYLEGSRNRDKSYNLVMPLSKGDKKRLKNRISFNKEYINNAIKKLSNESGLDYSYLKNIITNNKSPVEFADSRYFQNSLLLINDAKSEIENDESKLNVGKDFAANCIATATSNNPNPGHYVTGNETFRTNPGKYGWKEVSKDEIKPGGLIQMITYSTPDHAVILDSKEGNDMYVNYSPGNYPEYKRHVRNWVDPKDEYFYNFVGNSADSTRWTNEYNQLYGTQYAKGGPIVSPYGQWKYPGRDTIIPSNDITMDNVNYPVLGISDAGDAKVMMPWNDYKFRGSMVYEHPLVGHSAQDGKYLSKRKNEFVNRIESMQDKPDFMKRFYETPFLTIPDWVNANDVASHKMSWATDDKGNAIIYPNVQRVDGRLIDFTRPPYSFWAGYDSALRRGDTLMTTPEIADWWTRNYKEYYPEIREFNNNLYQLGGLAKPFSYNPIPPVRYQKGGNLSSYMNDSQLENARGIWNYLIGQKGLTQRNAAAMMGNVMQESGLNPNAKNPKSSAKGYFQMLDSKRKDYDKWLRNNPHSKDYGEFDYYVHLIDDVVDPYMDGYNSFMKRWEGVKKAYEAKPSDRNRQSMQEYQDYYDRMYRQRVENNRLFPVIDFNRAWNNYELPLNEITPLFEETFERAGEGSEHEKRNNYAQDFYDYFYDPDINRQEIFNWENNRHMQKRISPVPADFRLPNRPLAQSAQLPTDIYLNEMMLDMPSYNQLMYREKPQGYFFSNGGIHIKPENRGKFTRLKKRTGHSASWFKAHGTPAQKKMATFALNARHWNHKHDEGGYLYSEGGFLLAPYLYIE